MRYVTVCTLVLLAAVGAAVSQQSGNAVTTACDFQDGKEVSVRYRGEVKASDKATGRVWMPGGQPMWLFTQVGLSAANSEIPAGAYSLYIISEKDNWTLIVNKNVKADAEYDEAQDVARIPMPVGQVSGPQQQFTVVFGHVAPKQCNLRIYHGKTGTWAEFKEI